MLSHVTSKLGQPMKERRYRQYNDVGASNHELEGFSRHADQQPLCKTAWTNGRLTRRRSQEAARRGEVEEVS